MLAITAYFPSKTPTEAARPTQEDINAEAALSYLGFGVYKHTPRTSSLTMPPGAKNDRMDFSSNGLPLSGRNQTHGFHNKNLHRGFQERPASSSQLASSSIPLSSWAGVESTDPRSNHTPGHYPPV